MRDGGSANKGVVLLQTIGRCIDRSDTCCCQLTLCPCGVKPSCLDHHHELANYTVTYGIYEELELVYLFRHPHRIDTYFYYDVCDDLGMEIVVISYNTHMPFAQS